MQTIEHSEVAFAGYAEHRVDTLGDQGFDESVSGGSLDGRGNGGCRGGHAETVAGWRSALAATPIPTSAAEPTPSSKEPAEP